MGQDNADAARDAGSVAGLQARPTPRACREPPDGHYVVIQYESSFEHMKAAVQTITPMLDKDKH